MPKEIKYFKTIFFSFFAGLTLLTAFLIIRDIQKEKQIALDYARVEGRASFNKDLLYRRWAAMHGGVYVPVSDLTQPNPYLNYIPDRDITTSSGKKLTLMNPAYMTREVFNIAEDQYGVKGHITSLNPIRPGNTPDRWEKNALELFEQGEKEYSSIDTFGGKHYLRYMEVMVVEDRCMKCHSHQGYQPGDIRGGISVSVPLDNYTQIAQSRIKNSFFSYLIVFLFVAILSMIGYKRYLKELLKRNALYKKIVKSEAKLVLQNRDYAKLNQEFKIQNQELLKNVEKAEESDKLKTAFLSNLSHEIRTPMNGILGFSNLLSQKGLSGSLQQKYLSVIQQSGNRMLHLITDLVDISKIESGQMELHIESVCLNTLAQKIFDFYQPQAEAKNLKFELNKGLPDTQSYIMVDGLKVEQILTNLLDNAFKFTPAGKITFGYTLKNNKLVFNVSDSGVGIQPEVKDYVFDRFRKGGYGYLKEEDGSGLGLAICKAHVELMHGKIWVNSKPDKGSAFRFYIPYIPGTYSSHHKKVQLKNERNYDGINALIAEDDEVSYKYLEELLSENHAQVIRANHGKEAVKKFHEDHAINLILMDMKMPIMNGLDATMAIRKENANIPIIAQTAFASENDVRKALDAGCNDYIAKPIKKEELFEKLDGMLL